MPATALVRRLEAVGGRIELGSRVREVIVREGRAVGVRTVDGREVEARGAVLANVTAPALFLELLAGRHVPPRTLDDLRRFEWDTSTFKVDWTLDPPVPWPSRPSARRERSTSPPAWTA